MADTICSRFGISRLCRSIVQYQ